MAAMYRYLACPPEQPSGDEPTLWPTILFLHGAGERGDDLARLENFGPLGYAKKKGDASPFLVVAPQCPTGQWWEVAVLEQFLEHVRRAHPVDPDRLYLTGVSMGGFGTWQLAAAHPEWFAAAAPFCGGGDSRDARTLADLPIWVFHGAEDTVVPPEHSTKMVRALRAVHGRVHFTLVAGVGHDVWSAPYASDGLYQWFLAQRRGHPAQPRSTRAGEDPDD